MNFLFLKGFFRIFKTAFPILFSILNNKINKLKVKKGARGPRGCDVARRATWQRHAGQRSAHVAREYTIYIYRLYNI